MYRILLLLLITICSLLSCDEGIKVNSSELISEKTVEHLDSVFKELDVYKPASCLQGLLLDIVDSNSKYFDSTRSFYSLSFVKKDNMNFIVIEVSKFESVKVVDYTAVMTVKAATFLCRGEISLSELFIPIEKIRNVYLKINRDSTDLNLGIEPKLRGLFSECGAANVMLEIYVPVSISKYEMNVH